MLVARRKLLRGTVAFADAATLATGFAFAYVFTELAFQRKLAPFASYGWVLALIILTWLVCLHVFGFYNSTAYCSRNRLLSRLVQVQFFAGLLLLSSMYITRSEQISRLLLQTFLAFSFLLLASQKLVLAAYLERARRRTPSKRSKAVLVAARPAIAKRYLRLIQTHSSLLADIVAILSPDTGDGHNCSLGPRLPCRVPLGTIEDLPAVLRAEVVDEVIALSPLDSSTLDRLSRWCSVRGLLLRIWFEVPRPSIGVWAAEYFGDGAFLLSFATIPQGPAHVALKRVVDVVGATVGLIPLALTYLCYGIRLRRETGGSVLFRQQRVGKNGRPFTLYKFRTMRLGAEQEKAHLLARNEMSGPLFKIKDDPRVTATGHKLRRRHLDELPQFWNVLRGEMSLVGARPPVPDETPVYADRHRRRLSMKPGITGLWQLNGNGTVTNFEDVVRLDCEYIDNWSLWLDFTVLAKTVVKVMRGDAW